MPLFFWEIFWLTRLNLTIVKNTFNRLLQAFIKFGGKASENKKCFGL